MSFVVHTGGQMAVAVNSSDLWSCWNWITPVKSTQKPFWEGLAVWECRKKHTSNEQWNFNLFFLEFIDDLQKAIQTACVGSIESRVGARLSLCFNELLQWHRDKCGFVHILLQQILNLAAHPLNTALSIGAWIDGARAGAEAGWARLGLGLV